MPPIAISDNIMKKEQNLSATVAASTLNIVELVVGAKPKFETLVAAVIAAELMGALFGLGPFTVFGKLVLHCILFSLHFQLKTFVKLDAHFCLLGSN